ncbi:MAG: hypothetical protein E6Q97_06445 [Desulfurellales bacterium]|nr:MAG: hypothetical protein E6Q97_06445 [Desulfurellales bacterium]
MSSQKDFLFDHHIINGIVPKADAFATSGTTDWVSLANYRRVTFVIHTGNATGGTANGTVTVNASASAAGSSSTALAFKYRACASSTSVDTWGALTDATSSGFSMTAGDNYIYTVELTAEEVEAAAAGKYFVSLTVTESSNDPIDAAVLIILSEPRYPNPTPISAIA